MTRESPLSNPTSLLSGICIVTFAFLYAFLTWVVWCPILVVALVSPYTPITIRRKCMIFVSELTEMFQLLTFSVTELIAGVNFVDYGDLSSINKDENAIIICNHPSLVDWMVIWGFLSKYSHLRRFKVVLKKELQYLPFIGYAIQIGCMLFLARDWARDKDNMSSILEYYRNYSEYYCLLVFPEGTNIDTSSIRSSHSFAEKNHLKPIHELLYPRTTGFHHILTTATGLDKFFSQADELSTQEERDSMMTLDNMLKFVNLFSSVDAIYDFTLCYTPTRKASQVNMFAGKFPSIVHTIFNRIDILETIKAIDSIDLTRDSKEFYTLEEYNPFNGTSDDSKEKMAKMSKRTLFEEKTGVWLMKLWFQKDQKLVKFYDEVLQLATNSSSSTFNNKVIIGNNNNSSNSSDANTNIIANESSPNSSAGSTITTTTTTTKFTIPSKHYLSDPMKSHNTLLFDPTTYITNSKPTWYISLPTLILSAHTVISHLWMMFTWPLLRWWVLIYGIGSVLVLTILKVNLYEFIYKASKQHENNLKTQYNIINKKNDGDYKASGGNYNPNKSSSQSTKSSSVSLSTQHDLLMQILTVPSLQAADELLALQGRIEKENYNNNSDENLLSSQQEQERSEATDENDQNHENHENHGEKDRNVGNMINMMNKNDKELNNTVILYTPRQMRLKNGVKLTQYYHDKIQKYNALHHSSLSIDNDQNIRNNDENDTQNNNIITSLTGVEFNSSQGTNYSTLSTNTVNVQHNSPILVPLKGDNIDISSKSLPLSILSTTTTTTANTTNTTNTTTDSNNNISYNVDDVDITQHRYNADIYANDNTTRQFSMMGACSIGLVLFRLALDHFTADGV